MTNELTVCTPNPRTAGILAFIYPALGYYYAGLRFMTSLQIGALFVLVYLVILNAPPHFLSWKAAMIVSLVAALGLRLALCWHAAKIAQRHEGTTTPPRRYGRFIVTALAVGTIVGFIGEMPGVTSAKNYSVPTMAMEPTIIVGDRVRARLISYTADRLPDRGDLVVFKYPKDPSISYIKRVIGLPGDRIRISDDVLEVNGVPQMLQSHEHDRSILADITDQSDMKLLYKETIDRTEHWVLHNHPQTRPFTKPNWPDGGEGYTVPDNAVMVMGDNRDNSTDSRTYGAVPLDHLTGRVDGVVYSLKSSGIRWGRIGMDLK